MGNMHPYENKQMKSIDSINYAFNVALIWIWAWRFLSPFSLSLNPIEAPPKRDFIKENVKNLRLMQQNTQYTNQATKSSEYERKGPQQRKIRSVSHSRLCSSTNSVKTIRNSKSIENGEWPKKFKSNVIWSRYFLSSYFLPEWHFFSGKIWFWP